jgi:hypothetical protein
MEIKEYDKKVAPRVGIVAMYYGEPGTGKTFNALSYPSPMLVIDTENRCELVLRQQEDDKEVYIAPATNLTDIREALNFFYQKTKNLDTSSNILSKGTIVIDSATMLLQMAQEEYLKVSGAQKIYPQFMWGEVYAILDDLIMKLRNLGFNIVFTAQVKDEYTDQTKTGKRIIDIYKRIPFWCDLIVACVSDSETGARDLTVIKNGYGPNHYFKISSGMEGLSEVLEIKDDPTETVEVKEEDKEECSQSA